jgi:hypothetical protein
MCLETLASYSPNIKQTVLLFAQSHGAIRSPPIGARHHTGPVSAGHQ